MYIQIHRLAYLGLISLLLFVFPANAQTNTGDPIHIVISIEGTASFRQLDWSADVAEPLVLGAFVSTTDEIIPVGAAVIGILCADFEVDIITSVARPPDCADEPPVTDPFNRVGSGSSDSRGFEENVPYLISPRLSRLMNSRPAFSWQVIADAASYEIELLREDAGGALSSAWTTTYSATTGSLVYPAGEADLQPGVYIVKISAIDSGGNAIIIPQDADTGNRFTIVDITLVTALNSGVAAISNADYPSFTPPEMSDYVTAIYMLHNDFRAEALEKLSLVLGIDPHTLISVNTATLLSQSPAPFIKLAEVYASIGLEKEAIHAYEDAIVKTKNIHNRLFEAQARAALADMTSDPDMQWCQNEVAYQLYTQIGDSENAAMVFEELTDQAEDISSIPNCADVLAN